MGIGAVALGLLCVPLLAACGSSGNAVSDADLRNPMKGPMAQLLGYDTSPAEQRAQQLQVEQVKAECMKAEGWEYSPVDYSAQMGTYSEEYDMQMSDPIGYGEKYGYGVVRGYDMQTEQQNTDGSGESFVDPNQDYMMTLSEDEMQQYQEALYGQQFFDDGGMSAGGDGSEDTTPVMPKLEDQGCSGKAQLEVVGDSVYSNEDLMNRLNEMGTDAENDPDLKAATEKWVACMSKIDETYTWSTPDEIQSYLYDKLSQAQGFGSMPVDDGSGDSSGDGTTEETVAMSESNFDENGMPVVDEAAIEDLRKEEMQIWTDDQTCFDSSKLYEVRREAEQRIADQLLEEFPELAKK
ncbi:MAG: hypothetical protein WCO88_16305 [Actinomycetota bacterium]